MHRSRGFTLIEMMIAVAIIGILAGIAIAQYQAYVARSQVAEAVSLLTGAKTQVEDFAAQNGTLPTTAELLIEGIRDEGLFVDSITSDPDNDQLIATFKTSSVSAPLAGNTVVFTRNDTDGHWGCSIAESTTPSYLLPKSCL